MRNDFFPYEVLIFFQNELDSYYLSCWWIYCSVDIAWWTSQVMETSRYLSWDLSVSALPLLCTQTKMFSWKTSQKFMSAFFGVQFTLSLANTSAIFASMTWFLALFWPGMHDLSKNHGCELAIHVGVLCILTHDWRLSGNSFWVFNSYPFCFCIIYGDFSQCTS